MARRARVHSRDVQPQIAAPKGLFAAARVQRFDWPLTVATTDIDELGRKLHVGITADIPQVTITMEAFDVSHNTFSYLTGYTPATFPVSGASITEFKNVDVIGQIRDNCASNIVNALYVKRGIVTAMDATFGVRDNSTVTYTISSNSKKEFKQPVFYDLVTVTSGTATLSYTPTYLTRTSGYIIDSYVNSATCATNYVDEGLDFSVTGTTVTFSGSNVANGDVVWFTYCSSTTKTFEALDDAAPAAIQGKYVPVSISVNNIPRVQAVTIRAALGSEQILEMGGLGKPVGYEIGVPTVTGDLTVLKTDNELLQILTGQPTTAVESDVEYALSTLPLKVNLKDPRNPSRVVLTYYVPSITINAESDTQSVNQSMNEVFGWQSTTGDLYVVSGAGPW